MKTIKIDNLDIQANLPNFIDYQADTHRIRIHPTDSELKSLKLMGKKVADVIINGHSLPCQIGVKYGKETFVFLYVVRNRVHQYRIAK